MKKILFIDRDGTLIREPEGDMQVDKLVKFSFFPGAITFLGKIVRELDYVLVMVTNQDGLGTESFPEKDFWPLQELMLETFKNEGIHFEHVLIDRSFEHEKSPYRKPEIGLVKTFMTDAYDLNASYVIGDRWSDIELAKNLGCYGIFIHEKNGMTSEAPEPLKETVCLQTNRWRDVYHFLKRLERKASVRRKTDETLIDVDLNLDGAGMSTIDTGLPFFDHMLDQIAKHGGMDLTISVKGDLNIDEHHTIEDTAISLGQAFHRALGKKMGIQRYGFCLPMDDCLAQVAIDFGGRSWIEWKAEFKREKVGDMPTEMFYHFFKSFSDNALCNLNIKAEGEKRTP